LLYLNETESDEFRRILVLTAGITLQEQLIGKDIPNLNRLLNLNMPFGLLKGRRNYVCLRKAANLDNSGYLDFNQDGGHASLIISEWLKTTESGDLSELSFAPDSPAVMHVASSSKSCLGNNCPFMRNSCFIHKNFRVAQDWKIVVANYHLFFSHAAMGGFPVSYDILICDEAHRMADCARSAIAVEASGDDAKRLFRPRQIQPHEQLLKKYSIDSKEVLEKMEICRVNAEYLFELLQLLRDGESMTRQDEGLIKKAKELSASIDAMLRPMRLLDDTATDGPFSENSNSSMAAEVLNWKKEVKEFEQAIMWCIEIGKFPEWAYWRTENAVCSAPVKCPDLISEAISAGKPEKSFFVSATLAIENNFNFWIGETGVTPDKTLIVDSPFDFPRQMNGVIIPIEEKVGSPSYDDLAARVVEKLCDNNGGRTLVLLSSLRLMRVVASRMKSKQREYNILVQGKLSQAELLNRFREDVTSVLIGCVSFREGVDIPGDGLTQVIIDRIPFPHPHDPLTQARGALEGKDSFMRVTLPLAKMFLRQAAGRLIRNKTDKGQLVILDGRVLDRKDWKVRECLPKTKFSKMIIKKNKHE
jgi:ATP-dependent DNA helicase DinG